MDEVSLDKVAKQGVFAAAEVKDELAEIAAGFVTNVDIDAVIATLVDLNTSVSVLEDKVGDTDAARASAYAAQDYELQAAASALDARLSEAQNFPSDFLSGSKYWTGDNGQISNPVVAANNPLSGTFETVAGSGQIYRSLANPESCASFGPVGYFVGIPGTVMVLKARVRCIADLSNGAVSPNTGVGIIPMNAQFSLIQYIPGGGLGSMTVAMGWQEVSWTYVIPPTTDPTFGVYYRPTLFMNVVGNANPLTPSLDTQGNARFEIAWFRINVTVPAIVTVPVVQNLGGTGTYTTPLNATYLKVTLQAGGGGGAGSGATSGPGTDGANTTFGAFTAGFGSRGSVRSGGAATGGWRNRPGQAGGQGPGGYTFCPGAKGGGPYGGTCLGSQNGGDGINGSGGGGGGADSGSGTTTGGGGGEGGYIEIIIPTPAATYAYAIGAGGTGGAAGTGGKPGGAGGGGWATVEAHFS